MITQRSAIVALYSRPCYTTIVSAQAEAIAAGRCRSWDSCPRPFAECSKQYMVLANILEERVGFIAWLASERAMAISKQKGLNCKPLNAQLEAIMQLGSGNEVVMLYIGCYNDWRHLHTVYVIVCADPDVV